jgi:hypothetical protein
VAAAVAGLGLAPIHMLAAAVVVAISKELPLALLAHQ